MPRIFVIRVGHKIPRDQENDYRETIAARIPRIAQLNAADERRARS